MMKFLKKQRYTAELAPTTRDLAQIVKEQNVIPVPVYSDKMAKDLIILPRGIIFLRQKRKRKPIEF